MKKLVLFSAILLGSYGIAAAQTGRTSKKNSETSQAKTAITPAEQKARDGEKLRKIKESRANASKTKGTDLNFSKASTAADKVKKTN